MTPQRNNLYLSLLILAVGASVSFAIAVQAQTAEAGITFPIPELGNCGSKEECKAYCDDPANMPACIRFAKSHGLMNEAEASRAEKFGQRLVADGGPGGCRTPKECETFCSNLNNIEACISFAEEHGVEDKHVKEGKKILAYIQAGGQMPGGCTSKESCEAYCGDFNHAEECFSFAERAGIEQVREGAPSPEQFQKFLELAKRGETPGGCKSKDECENYCRSADRFEECVTFGERAGFIQSEQAQKIRATGGFGPGGCNSEESCKAYCNDPAHQEECFRFAEEHGFIKEEEIKRAKEGLVHLRAGLEQAPPEIAACLKSVLGPNIIEDIQSGKLTPGPDIGERVRHCQEKFGHRVESHRIFSDAPPEVVACLREKLGDSFEKVRSGETQPTPEMADTFRVCFNQVQFMQGNVPGAAGGFAPDGQEGPSNTFYDFIRTAPPGVAGCLERQLGGEYARLKSGEAQLGSDFKQRVEVCFREFQPMPPPHPQEPPSASDGRGPCPAMPTVGGCPSGQERVVIFQSSECGVYYGCKGSDATAPRPDGATPGVQTIDPTKLLQPFVAPLAPQTITPQTSAFACRSLEECHKYCSDSASPYFGTPECEKFRSGQSSLSQ